MATLKLPPSVSPQRDGFVFEVLCDIAAEWRININISVLWALQSQLGVASRSMDLSIIDLRIFQHKRSQLQPKSLFGRARRRREEEKSRERPFVSLQPFLI